MTDEMDILVIPVGVGKQIEMRDLENVTPHKRNIIQVPSNEMPKKLAEKVADKIKAGI